MPSSTPRRSGKKKAPEWQRAPSRSGTLRINERRPASPPRRLVKPKTEGKKKAPEWQAPPEYVRAAARMEAPADSEESPGERIAIEASYNEVLPAPDDVADAWSARMYEEEVERQRERAATTGHHIPPPPPPEYYILDPSDEDEEVPAPTTSRWHDGDDGAGPSNAAGSGSDDDGGDYSHLIYSQLGM